MAELQAALRELTLSVGGLKAVFQQRLQDAHNMKGDSTSLVLVDGRDRINQDDVPTENYYARFEHEAIEDCMDVKKKNEVFAY